MSGQAKLATFPVKLNGQQLSIIADPARAGLADEPGYNGQWAALTTADAISNGDVAVPLRHFTGGHGAIERRDDSDDLRYAWAEDGFTHLADGFSPSGLRQSVGPDLGLGKTDRAVVDSRLFDGHLWCITSGGTVVRLQNADPSLPILHDPALNAFGSATASLDAGYVCKAIEVFGIPAVPGVGLFDNATVGNVPTPALYVSGFNPSTGGTRLYQYTGSHGWTSSSGDMAYRFDRLCVVWWEDASGVGAARLVGQVDDITIRVCTDGANPLLNASWTSPIRIGNPGYPIRRLLAAPAMVFVRKDDGIWTFNGIRSMNLTPGWANETSLNGRGPSVVWNDKVVSARGFGMDLYDASVQFRQQRRAAECGPSYGVQDGSPIVGQVTAFASQNGPLFMALWNADLKTSYVGRAYDRLYGSEEGAATVLTEEIPNPLRHYWAEQVIRPTLDVAPPHLPLVGQQVTHLAAVAPTVTATTTMPARSVNLLMFTADVPTVAGYHHTLYYAPLPTGSGPISMKLSGNTDFRFNPQAVLYLTAQQWGDRAATKHILMYETATQNVSANTPVEIQARPDGAPATMLVNATWKSEGVITVDNAELVPDVATTGHLLGFRAFVNADPTTTPPYLAAAILRELSPRAKVARQVLDTRVLYVVLERDHRVSNGAIDLRGPDSVYMALMALQTAGPAPFYDEEDKVWSAVLDQGVTYGRIQIEGRKWRTIARIRLRLIPAQRVA